MISKPNMLSPPLVLELRDMHASESPYKSTATVNCGTNKIEANYKVQFYQNRYYLKSTD